MAKVAVLEVRNENRIVRLLVLHPAEDIRRSIADAIRAAVTYPVTLFESESLSEAFLSVPRLDPHCILLDLSEERALALKIAQEFRGSTRRIIGLYNPLLMKDKDDAFFREAARAGIGDFVPLPAGGDELAAALEAALGNAAGDPARDEGRQISFFGPKGGVGTTTLAVNTAVALAEATAAEREVVLCDAVLPFGTAAAFLGIMPDRDLADLAADLDDLGALSQYLFRHPGGLSVLASPRDLGRAESIGPEELSQALIALRRRFGLVVVDGGSTMDLLTLSILDLSDDVFVVTEAVTPALLATARFLRLLERQGFAQRTRVVVNRHSTDEGVLEGRAVDERLGRPVDYVIREEKAVVGAASSGVPLVSSRPKTGFSEAVRRLAADAVASDAPRVRETEGVV